MKKTLKSVFLTLMVFVLINLSGHAEIRSFGHNLSHTDYTIADKTCVLGYQVVACGNGNVAVAVSPFLLHLYSMKNIYLRLNTWETDNFKNTFELAYFDTFNGDEEDPSTFYSYQMQSIWFYHILTFKISDNYKLHLNTNVNYYLDDTRPFSLRRPTVKQSPWQLNLTTLHETNITKHFGILGEVGVLHLTDVYPRLHLGMSLAVKSESFLLQFGFSVTSTLDGLFNDSYEFRRNDFQNELIGYEEGYSLIDEYPEEYIKHDFSIHPEIAVQYKF